MSKIFLLGDSHIGLGYPNKTDHWFKVHQEYFDKFLIPLLIREVKEGDIIIHLGDLFDNRNVIPINLLNYAMDIVVKISKIAPFHIIVGNHDCWHKSSSQITTLRPFRYIPNVFIYDKVKKIEYMGKKLLMMPYFEKKSDQIKSIYENKDCEYLFCHSDLNGAKMHLTSVAHKNQDKIDVEEFSCFKKVYSGHLHINQVNKNFTFVGNLFEMDRNDLGNQKGIFILDVIDGSERFIQNMVSPKFRKVYLRTEEDILSLDTVSTKDYIDLFISNSLLINNRKLRRKLEAMLESGNFASVEYLDDITIQKAEKGESIVESNSEDIENNIIPTIQLEYTEMIREYINNQKHDSEKIKSGVLQEFNEVVRIYDENYRGLSE